jgi:hypothetical protein
MVALVPGFPLYGIQHFRLNTDPDPFRIRIRIQSVSRVFMTKNLKIFTAEKKFNFFGSKTTIYVPIPRPP